MIEWTWEENSVLYKTSPYISPNEIFAAVCAELGRYFTPKGAKYTKSSRKLKFRLGTVRLETAFWSSHGNTAGEWVNLEIVSTVYAADKSGMEKNGLLYFGIKPKNFNVYGIDVERFSEIVEYIGNVAKSAKVLNTREGLKAFLAENSETEEQFVNKHPNNRVYFDGISEVQDNKTTENVK